MHTYLSIYLYIYNLNCHSYSNQNNTQSLHSTITTQLTGVSLKGISSNKHHTPH